METQTTKCLECKRQVPINDSDIIDFITDWQVYKLCDDYEKKHKRMYDEAFWEMAEMEREVSDHNKALLKSISKNAHKHLDVLLYGCELTSHEKMVIVDKPRGHNNNESVGCFGSVWIEQWSTGMEGDSYAGYIYAKYTKNKWLKISYWC